MNSSFKSLSFCLVAALACAAGGVFLTEKLAGKKPSQTLEEFAPDAAAALNKKNAAQASAPAAAKTEKILTPFWEAARQDPDKLENWTKLAGVLQHLITSQAEANSGHSQASNTAELEQLKLALLEILRRKPQDQEYLGQLADVYFQERSFAEALSAYQQVVKLAPGDLFARGKLASAYTFLGKLDEAIAELNAIIKKDPSNFQGHAYLAIAYSQKGEIEKARTYGEQALKLAPSEEAFRRFAGFLEKITPAQASAGQGAATQEVPAAKATTENTHPTADSDAEALSYLKTNSITAPKFHSLERKGSTVTLFFQDFPMQHMPPFAKEKFLGTLKGIYIKDRQIAELKFVDRNSGKLLETFPLARQ